MLVIGLAVTLLTNLKEIVIITTLLFWLTRAKQQQSQYFYSDWQELEQNYNYHTWIQQCELHMNSTKQVIWLSIFSVYLLLYSIRLCVYLPCINKYCLKKKVKLTIKNLKVKNDRLYIRNKIYILNTKKLQLYLLQKYYSFPKQIYSSHKTIF